MSNPSFSLAHWFVKDFLGREWDSRFDGKHLGNAKLLINPKEGLPLDVDVIKFCLEKMKAGEWRWDKPITSLWVVTYGEPAYYQRAVDMIANAPPVYEVTNYDQWVTICGRMAINIGVWDGAYRGWENPLEKEFRLNPLQLSEVVS